jgi:hypothetical protein
MTDRLDNRSLGDLVAELSRETRHLVRKEIELATTEMTAKAKQAAAHGGVAAVGGTLIHAGTLVLVAMLVIALANTGLAVWLAALIVGVATAGAGYLLVNRGLSRLRRTSIMPEQTIETLKGDTRWTTGQGT